MNILQTVTYKASIAIAKHSKSHVVFRLAYLHLTLANSKDQCQGHAHFDCEYPANDDRANIAIADTYVACDLSISILTFDVGQF